MQQNKDPTRSLSSSHPSPPAPITRILHVSNRNWRDWKKMCTFYGTFNKLTDLGSDTREAKWFKNYSRIGSKPF